MSKSRPATLCSEERKSALIREALGLLKIQKNEDIVGAWIEDLAKAFRSRLHLWEDSPSHKDLRRQLEQIRKRAIELEQLLAETWPYAHAAAAGYCSLDDWQEHTEETWPFARADAEATGDTEALGDTAWKYSDSPDDWQEHGKSRFFEKVIEAPAQARTALPKIADAAAQILKQMPAQRRNLEAQFQGLPKQWLAVEGQADGRR